MLNFNRFSAVLGLVALGAMTSCSVKEDVAACRQQVFVDLRTFDVAMDGFSSSGDAAETKSSDASSTVDAISFSAFDASGNVAYSTTQCSSDEGFGSLNFELAPGSYTFVAVGQMNSTTAPAGAVSTIDSPSSASLPEQIVTDVFSGTQAATVQPRTDFSTAMTLPRVISRFRLKMTDAIPSNVATLEIVANSSAASSSEVIVFDPSDGTVASDRQFMKTFDVTSKVGRSNVAANVGLLLTSDEQTIAVSVKALDASGATVTSLSLPSVPMKRNRITTASGELFSASGSGSFLFNSDWLEGHEMSY